MTGILPEPPRRAPKLWLWVCRLAADDRMSRRTRRRLRDRGCARLRWRPRRHRCGCGGGGSGARRRRRAEPGSGSAADVARKLGRTPHFLVGMGNDLAQRPQPGRRLHAGRHAGSALRVHGRPARAGRLARLERGRDVREHPRRFGGRQRRDADVHAVRDGVDRRRQPVRAGDGFVHAARTGTACACCSSASPCSTSRRWCTSSPTSGPTRSRCRAATRPACPCTSRAWCPSAPACPTIWPASGTASSGWGACSRPRR